MFGRCFRKCREDSGLTEKELVEKLREMGHHITLARYLRLEADQSEAYLNDLKYMSRVLHISPDQVLEDYEEVNLE